jgi:hypothetical protein
VHLHGRIHQTGGKRPVRQEVGHSDECMRQWSTARRFVSMVEAMSQL